MLIPAFDPGLSGGYAAVDGHGDLVIASDIPTIGDGAQRRVDAANLSRNICALDGQIKCAVVEQVGARPGQGVSSMFRFGQAYGTIFGILGALDIAVSSVTPGKWKKALGLGSDGDQSRARAIETWPALAAMFSRKMDHNRAEAALLALYGWREMGGAK